MKDRSYKDELFERFASGFIVGSLTTTLLMVLVAILVT
jgi:hypothetical protein